VSDEVDVTSLLTGIERVPVGVLRGFPGNPRRGNVGLIAESLVVNKQYTPLVVQRATRFVLAGNHTLAAAVSLGWEFLDVVYVDVDDEQARRIMLSSNATSDASGYDVVMLQEILVSLDDFAGSGWSPDALDDMLMETAALPVLPAAPVYNSHSESEVETAQRAAQFAGSVPRKAFGVREAVLILPQTSYDDLQTCLQLIKQLHPAPLNNGDATLLGLRAACNAARACAAVRADVCACPWHKASNIM
jgi:hypothetical protein